MITSESSFLKGHQSRWKELFFTIRVFFQFIKGFRNLHFIGPCITIFGSARFKEDHPYYQMTEEMAFKLSQAGFAIMTGGGPGIMEAANKGAKKAGGISLGCNLVPLQGQKITSLSLLSASALTGITRIS
jgi:predicted Rossmann-fold nucleotide-binding protein